MALSCLTKPFRFSSKDFLARILESDKAENFGSLLIGAVTAGFATGVFSSVTAVGFAVSIF
jgi:hypothetical protein